MNTVQTDRCGIILLAAGRSARLGKPKQQLIYEGKTLLRRSVDAALATGAQLVIVVLGAYHDLLANQLEGIKGIRIVLNHEWEEGMASSIRCGMEAALQEEQGLSGLIMMVCDQPFVTPEILKGIYQKHVETGMPVVASSYGDSPGVPAFFDKCFFSKLLSLKGDTGARRLIKEYAEQVSLFPFPQGATDIDTGDDYTTLIEKRREGND